MPDVFYHRFVAAQLKWDSPSWEDKPRAFDDGMANGVSDALCMLSHVDCHADNRYAATTVTFVRASVAAGHHIGYGTVVFDHDQAYQQVPQRADFRCLVPLVSPGDTMPVEG